MTRKEFKKFLKELIFSYLHNAEKVPDSIEFDYHIDDGAGRSHGELIFRTPKRDYSFKIKKIDY